MSTLLRLATLLSLIWTSVLLAARFGAHIEGLAALNASLADMMIVCQISMAIACWLAARDPRQNLAVIIATITFMAGKVVVNVYHALMLLPPATALLAIADLILSFSLLVGLLEALPRVVRKS